VSHLYAAMQVLPSVSQGGWRQRRYADKRLMSTNHGAPRSSRVMMRRTVHQSVLVLTIEGLVGYFERQWWCAFMCDVTVWYLSQKVCTHLLITASCLPSWWIKYIYKLSKNLFFVFSVYVSVYIYLYLVVWW